jgi:hypothetical protein
VRHFLIFILCLHSPHPNSDVTDELGAQVERTHTQHKATGSPSAARAYYTSSFSTGDDGLPQPPHLKAQLVNGRKCSSIVHHLGTIKPPSSPSPLCSLSLPFSRLESKSPSTATSTSILQPRVVSSSNPAAATAPTTRPISSRSSLNSQSSHIYGTRSFSAPLHSSSNPAAFNTPAARRETRLLEILIELPTQPHPRHPPSSAPSLSSRMPFANSRRSYLVYTATRTGQRHFSDSDALCRFSAGQVGQDGPYNRYPMCSVTCKTYDLRAVPATIQRRNED